MEKNLRASNGGFGFSCGSDGKESVCNAGDPGSISGMGRSPGEGNGNPLQQPCLENSMDRGAWQATAHGFAKSLTQLNTLTSEKKKIPFVQMPKASILNIEFIQMTFVYTCLNLLIPVANDKICCLLNFVIKLSRGKKGKNFFSFC